MISVQEGKCSICGEELKNSFNSHVDHNHMTGEVREILCSGCNAGLGNFDEDPDRLVRAASYLSKHSPDHWNLTLVASSG